MKFNLYLKILLLLLTCFIVDFLFYHNIDIAYYKNK